MLHVSPSKTCRGYERIKTFLSRGVPDLEFKIQLEMDLLDFSQKIKSDLNIKKL